MSEKTQNSSPQRLIEFGLNFVQVLPLIIFAQTRGEGVTYLDRFAWGAAGAVTVLALLLVMRRRPHPLWASYDIWLIASAALLHSGIPALMNIMDFLRETSFFVMSAITVCGYLLLSPRGFFDSCLGADLALCRRYSLIYLGLTGAALLWALGLRGDEMMAGVVPAIALGVVYLGLERLVSPSAASPVS